MPQRKPFRPLKNRSRDRFQSGAGNKRKVPEERAESKAKERHASSPKERKFPSPKGIKPFVAKEHQRDVAPTPPKERSGERSGTAGGYWIYGHHAVLAAIDNPKRRIRRLAQSGPAGERAAIGGADRPLPAWETVDRQALDRFAGRESVHQGVAAQVEPLPEVEIEDIAAAAANRPDATIVILDQVTDPHNVGAILRSAAAFGALAVVLTERHAAPETGVLAKAASGALEIVPLVRVANLARAMEQLKGAGFWCVGLAAEAQRTLADARLSGRVALCLGAEGAGLRRLTRAHCDLLVKLPTSGPIDHLNVSNAAAVSLYELARGATR